MKEVKLTETNKIVYLTNDECLDIDVDKLNLKDIYNKRELINFIQIKSDEKKSIEISTPYLHDLNIEIKEVMDYRYSHYDVIAVSAVTNMFNEQYKEEILLEFKYRTGTTCNQYSSVIIDSIKARELLNEYNKSNRRIFVINVYIDNHIRILEFSKHYKNYSTYKESNVINAKYRSNVKKIKRLIEYDSELTTLM